MDRKKLLSLVSSLVAILFIILIYLLGDTVDPLSRSLIGIGIAMATASLIRLIFVNDIMLNIGICEVEIIMALYAISIPLLIFNSVASSILRVTIIFSIIYIVLSLVSIRVNYKSCVDFCPVD